MTGVLLHRVWLTLARGNELAQAAGDVLTPGVRADIKALIGRHEPGVSESDLGLVAILRDIEDDVGTVPLSLVLDEVEVVVQDVPCHFLARHEFGDLERMGRGPDMRRLRIGSSAGSQAASKASRER